MISLRSVSRFKRFAPAIMLAALMAYLGIFKIIHRPPDSVHVWAQCDRASVARNYAEESMNFFLPRVHENRGGTGITGMEFPLMNYLTAVCYKIFGFSEFFYRLLMLLAISAGLLFAIPLSIQLTGHYLTGIFTVLLWYSSPILVFYSANFLPDTASLGFILIAWFYFFRMLNAPSRNSLLLLFLFSSLAALVKSTSLISVIVMLVIVTLDRFRIVVPGRRMTSAYFFPVLNSLIAAIIVTFSWYSYARYLSQQHASEAFLLGINPAESWEMAAHVIGEAHKIWRKSYYDQSVYLLMLVSGIGLLICIKKANRLLLLIAAGLWMGNICFFVLMLNQFRAHDYYVICLLPAVLFQFIAFFELLHRALKNKRLKILPPVLSATVFAFAAFHAWQQHEFRYDTDGWMYGNLKVSYYHKSEQYLRTLGIKRTDLVLSLFDDGPKSLYYMNVKGWRVPGNWSDRRILKLLEYKPKYVILNDTEALKRTALQPLFTNQIGSFERLKIYRLD